MVVVILLVNLDGKKMALQSALWFYVSNNGDDQLLGCFVARRQSVMIEDFFFFRLVLFVLVRWPSVRSVFREGCRSHKTRRAYLYVAAP